VNFLKFVTEAPLNETSSEWDATPTRSLPHFTHEVDENNLIEVYDQTNNDVGFYLFSLKVELQGYPATSSPAIQL